MALTLTNSNYNGEVLESLYLAVGVDNEVINKGVATIVTDIAERKALPKLSQTDSPIGDYATGVPQAVTATTSYAERELVMAKMTVYETFLPTTFHEVWKIWQSTGDFTNLQLNSKLMQAIMKIYKNGIGRQMSKLAFQGDTNLGAGNALNKFNGWVTRAILDASVIKPTPAGNITDSNFMDILSAVWAAIPDHFIDDPNYTIMVNTTDYKVMQAANTKLKEAYTGVFGQSLETMFQTKKIQHFAGMPQYHILAGKSDNLYLGVWVAPDSESVVVDKVANNSREWFLRLDFKADANYVNSGDLVLYTPV